MVTVCDLWRGFHFQVLPIDARYPNHYYLFFFFPENAEIKCHWHKSHVHLLQCTKRGEYSETIPVLHMCDQKYKCMSLWEENCQATGNLYMKNSLTITTCYKVVMSCEPKLKWILMWWRRCEILATYRGEFVFYREGITGGWKKFDNGDIQNIYSSQCNIKAIRRKRVWRMEHAARTGNM